MVVEICSICLHGNSIIGLEVTPAESAGVGVVLLPLGVAVGYLAGRELNQCASTLPCPSTFILQCSG